MKQHCLWTFPSNLTRRLYFEIITFLHKINKKPGNFCFALLTFYFSKEFVLRQKRKKRGFPDCNARWIQQLPDISSQWKNLVHVTGSYCEKTGSKMHTKTKKLGYRRNVTALWYTTFWYIKKCLEFSYSHKTSKNQQKFSFIQIVTIPEDFISILTVLFRC